MLEYLIAFSLLQGSVEATDTNEPGLVGIWNNAMSKVISKVYIDSPADKAGVKPGDLIKSFKPSSGKPGDSVTLTVRRGKEEIVFEMVREPKRQYLRKDRAYYCKEGVKFERN